MALDAASSNGINRRCERRESVRRNGTLSFKDCKRKLTCRVIDLSAGGAQLKVQRWRLLPDEFVLEIEGGPSYRAVACFRRAGVIGVRFLSKSEL